MESISIFDQFQGFLNTSDILLNSKYQDIISFDFPEVISSASLKKDLKGLDHPRNSVLGKRMESFFEIAIKYIDRYELIASNIQIIENKQTLGELDFLVFDRQRKIPLHIELVYKLYVYDPELDPEIKKWIGPNRRDSFSEKLEKLKSRQFPLLYKPETFSYLRELGISIDDIEQQLCFKAQLFTPEKINLKDQGLINLASHVGLYYNLNEFLKMDWQQNLFYSPKKKDWSCNPEKNSNWIDREKLIKDLQVLFENEKSPLVWMKTATTYHTFFIVWW